MVIRTDLSFPLHPPEGEGRGCGPWRGLGRKGQSKGFVANRLDLMSCTASNNPSSNPSSMQSLKRFFWELTSSLMVKSLSTCRRSLGLSCACCKSQILFCGFLRNRLTTSCWSVGSGVEVKGVEVMFVVVRDETGLANGL